jgi:hypothetical protein
MPQGPAGGVVAVDVIVVAVDVTVLAVVVSAVWGRGVAVLLWHDKITPERSRARTSFTPHV